MKRYRITVGTFNDERNGVSQREETYANDYVRIHIAVERMINDTRVVFIEVYDTEKHQIMWHKNKLSKYSKI